MWALLNTPAYAPFIIAGFVLLILLAVEIFSYLFGGLSGFLDNVVPDSLLEADFDADADMDFHGDVSIGLKALDWLYVGRIPTMILLILFIGSFSITGLIIQQLSISFLGYPLSPWLASLDAIVISIPLLRILARVIYPIMPKDETTAVSGDSLVGKTALLVIGHASSGNPAQAKVIDEHGLTHYVMVEPDPSLINDKPSSSAPFISSEQPTTVPSQDSDLITTEDTLVITKKTASHYLVKKVH